MPTDSGVRRTRRSGTRSATSIQTSELVSIEQHLMERIEALEGQLVSQAQSIAATAAQEAARRVRAPRPTAADRETAAAVQRGKVSAKQAIEKVLTNAGGPLHVSKIVPKVLKVKGVKLTGETPAATIQAILATENAKGSDGLFQRTSPGTYKMRSRRGRRA